MFVDVLWKSREAVHLAFSVVSGPNVHDNES